jgi:hypothetical protein
MNIVYEINEDWREHSWGMLEWFQASIEPFKDDAPSTEPNDYDYIQVIPDESASAYPFGNDGAQGFRHRETGWTFPDHCRQNGGRPELWHQDDMNKPHLSINGPISSFIVREL